MTEMAKTDFYRNVATLASGTTLAQLIPVAVAPILTRLYSPENFGHLALFLSIAAILSIAAGGRYEVAIMLPRSDRTAGNILLLSLLITAALGLLLFVIAGLVAAAGRLNGNGLNFPLWYLLPLSVLFIGITQAYSVWLNRRKSYKNLAAAKFSQSLTTAVGQLGGGAAGLTSGGLIAGAVAGQMVMALMVRWRSRLPVKALLSAAGKHRLMAVARRFADFPKFSASGAVVNMLSLYLVQVVIPFIFSTAILGLYSLVYRVLAMPAAVIGQSVSQVYFQVAGAEKMDSGSARQSFRDTLRRLCWMAAPIFAALYWLVEDLFGIVFGEEWRIAGEYARILLPLFAIRFISSALSSTMTVFEKLREALYIHLILVVANIALAAGAFFLGWTFVKFLYIYMISLSLLYGAFLVYYYRLAIGK